MITETSALGSDDIRLRWLKSSVASIKSLRAQGVPVIGYTWFPLFTMVDWRYRFAKEPVDHFYLELGLYTLNREASTPRWLETPLVREFQKYIRTPENAVGTFRALNASAHL
jgi:hypothetical protein